MATVLVFFFTVLGGALLADNLRWRLLAQRVTGTVTGVHQIRANDHRLIYQYTDALGQGVQATSMVSTGMASDPGRIGSSARLMVFANHPHRIREASSYTIDLFAVSFFSVPAIMLYVLLRSWPVQDFIALLAACGGGPLPVRWHESERRYRRGSDGAAGSLCRRAGRAAGGPPCAGSIVARSGCDPGGPRNPDVRRRHASDG
jgi:hypothetical protein